MPPEQIKKSVDERFDKEFPEVTIYRESHYGGTITDISRAIKSFIQKELSQREQEIKESLREEIENDEVIKIMREKTDCEYGTYTRILALLANVSPKTTDNKEKV